MNTHAMNDIIGSTDFRIQHFTIRELMLRMDDGQLDGDRVEWKMWDEQKQISFIESILSGIPIASFYFNGAYPQWTVLDGVERIHAIRRYVLDGLQLKNLELLSKEYNGYFSELLPSVKRRFMNTSVMGYVLTTELPREVLSSIFKRLND